MTCVAVIIAAPRHEEFLQPLIQFLKSAPAGFDEIVVVTSGFRVSRKGLSVPPSSKAWPRIRIVAQELQSAGANRNVGLESSDSEFVFFMDADDLYSVHRSTVAMALYEREPFDLLLHGFTPFTHGDSLPAFPNPPEDIKTLEIVRESALYEATLLRSPRNRALELKGETESTNLLFNDPSEAFEIQHAHAIVRRETVGDIRYHEEFGIRNEDGVFARDMLEAGKKVLLTPFVLSAYRHGARAKPRKTSNFFGRQR